MFGSCDCCHITRKLYFLNALFIVTVLVYVVKKLNCIFNKNTC